MKEKDLTYKLMTVKQICDGHPWLTEAGFRTMIQRADSNGLRKCIHKIGARVLIDSDGFQEWIKEQSS